MLNSYARLCFLISLCCFFK